LTKLLEEPLFLLKDVPKSPAIGPRRNGGRMDVRTAFRWSTTGVCGVVLETVVQGSQRYTSVPAIHRFFAAVTEAKKAKGGTKKPGANTEKKPNASDVESELDRLGF